MSASDEIPTKPVVFFANPRMPVLTPILKARFEIDRLSQDPELMYNAVFGRQRNNEDEAEEARRQKLYFERFTAIVKKYGVEEEYLAPLIEKRNQLWTELAKVCQEIQAIRA